MLRTRTARGPVTGALVLAVTAAGLIASPPAQAAGTVSVGAAEDTFVTATSPTAAGGTATTARASSAPKIAYYKFTVAGLPAGAQVSGATLKVVGVGSQTAAAISAYNVASTWNESTTYNTRPALGSLIKSGVNVGNGVAASFPVPVSGNGTVSFAVTKPTGGDNILGTRENATASVRPTLTVNYTVPAPEPTPTPDPTPAPTSGAGFDVLGITQTQLNALPIGTPSWNTLKAMADAAYTVDATSGNPDGSGNAVAGGLVYARTGDATYKTKVNNALDAVQAIAPASWDQAAANRHMGGWVAAAQLVGRPARNADGTLNSWGQWVTAQLTVTHAGGVPRNQVMLDTARGWDNNHGAAARQSVAAIEAYLGLDLTTSCNAMKAWLGGTFAGYAFVTDTTPSAGQMGWTDNGGAPSWYVTGHLSGVNPSTAWAGTSVPAMKDGAIPSDTERDGGTYPTIGANGADHYIYGNLYREAATMVTLAANGCSLWNYADNALARARAWAAANVPDHEGDYLGNADPLLNAVYGTSYPATVGTGENMLAASAWLVTGGQWPVR